MSREEKRQKLYRVLLNTTRETTGYAVEALESSIENPEMFPKDFAESIAWLIIRGEIVISQTEKRVINGEKVPATEKLVSIFESHTDVIVKDNRDTFYGHKICLTAGKSSLVFYRTLRDNP